MIFGRKQQVETDGVRKCDYMGCPYPEGYINPDFPCLFNYNDIQEVVSTCYEDQEERTFSRKCIV